LIILIAESAEISPHSKGILPHPHHSVAHAELIHAAHAAEILAAHSHALGSSGIGIGADEAAIGIGADEAAVLLIRHAVHAIHARSAHARSAHAHAVSAIHAAHTTHSAHAHTPHAHVPHPHAAHSHTASQSHTPHAHAASHAHAAHPHAASAGYAASWGASKHLGVGIQRDAKNRNRKHQKGDGFHDGTRFWKILACECILGC
jgi:hypothetical protein